MNNESKNILLQLSSRQQEAVKYIDGPLLVLAGAGSGKTRVLTHKIAWLIAEGEAYPEGITAVTFTNKAAGEMRARINTLVPGKSAARVQAGTFHGWGLKFLMRRSRTVRDMFGINGLTVIDRADCRALMQDIMKELKFPEKESSPAQALEMISRDYMRWSPIPHESDLDGNYYRLSKEYRKRLRESYSVDLSRSKAAGTGQHTVAFSR